MENKFLRMAALFIIIGIVSLIISISLVSLFDPENNQIQQKKSGRMLTFEADNYAPQYQVNILETSKRFDNKYLEYLDSIKESRDNTFYR